MLKWFSIFVCCINMKSSYQSSVYFWQSQRKSIAHLNPILAWPVSYEELPINATLCACKGEVHGGLDEFKSAIWSVFVIGLCYAVLMA